MSKQIQELIDDCSITRTEYFDGRGNVTTTYFDKHKFAELILRKVTSIVRINDEETLSEADIRTRIILSDINQYFGIK